MQILTSPASLSEQCRAWHAKGEQIALVPTMGYYHQGHEALIQRGRTLGDRLVVSLFVNPTQFGPQEDLAAYPRAPERDAQIAEKLGADILFMPNAEDMYSQAHTTWIEVPKMASTLCGASRPGHFRGVCTVVLKLFMLSQANVAVFGEKDWQQLMIIKRMVEDLDLPIKIESMPTQREADGLALSSRNVYLRPNERAQAAQIRAALLKAREAAQAGMVDILALRELVLEHFAQFMPLAKADYLAIVDPYSLDELEHADGPALMACAVKLGKARLIDNILLRQ